MLIGSRALAHWVPTFGECVKLSSDWDYIGSPVDAQPKSEIQSLDLLNNRDALQYNVNGVCSLKGLALIKRSHLHRDYFFDKHITMYHKWILPNLKEPFTDSDVEFLKTRTKLTKLEFPQGTPSLNKTNEDFFDDAVEKKYDHDWLHELYAYGESPVYTLLKDDETMAWCKRSKWEDLDAELKLKCVAEETHVIATERFLVPTNFKTPYKLAYMKALKKVCTTLTSGWFRDFAIDNYPSILELFDRTKINNVRNQLK